MELTDVTLSLSYHKIYYFFDFRAGRKHTLENHVNVEWALFTYEAHTRLHLEILRASFNSGVPCIYEMGQMKNSTSFMSSPSVGNKKRFIRYDLISITQELVQFMGGQACQVLQIKFGSHVLSGRSGNLWRATLPWKVSYLTSTPEVVPL